MTDSTDLPLDLKICPGCGGWRAEPVVAPGEPVLVCGECGHRAPFRQLPLFLLTGPGGGGKSTVARLLPPLLADVAVVVEQDVLWSAGLRDPADDFGVFRSTWLRMAAMIGQSGRPVVLAGTVVPPQLEDRPERVFFSRTHYLALTCDPDRLRQRLRARPAWRGWDEPRIAEMVEFTQWLQDNAPSLDPPVALLDTTALTAAATAAEVLAWVHRGLQGGSTDS